MNRIPCLIAAFVFSALTGAPLCATDLTKIDRTIAKEPAYKAKPKYCLLVFGPEAKQRVWLALDGDTLYVDRNGNGDLTEADERIARDKEDDPSNPLVTFKISELRVGNRVHKDLQVWVSSLDRLADSNAHAKALMAKDPRARRYHVKLDMEMPGWKGAGIGGRVNHATSSVDINGVLQFAGRPQDAPIIHMGGPLQVTLPQLQELRIGRATEIALGVGSPGLGAGTHTYLAYEGVIPEKAYPTLDILYPPKKPGDAPLRQKHELKDRC